MASRDELVTVEDGTFNVPLWLPESERGPGVLVLQEIFGVNAYIRAVAADLAAIGYVAAAPDLFWRLTPNWQAEHDEQGLKASFELAQQFDVPTGVRDSIAALNHLAAIPEVTDKTGVIGFCMGGSLGHMMAAQTSIDAVVSLYGSRVPATLDLLDQITGRVQYHFGGSDDYIPRDEIAKVEAAVSDRDNLEIHVHENAGHAFHNFMAPQFHQAEAAKVAWELTVDFLAAHLR